MKRILAIVLILNLTACAGFNPFKQVANPVSGTNIYEAELVFDASLKTFNELKGLCVARVLPRTCRTYVISGQRLIVKAYAADKAARNFVTTNPTLDATNAIQAFTGIVSDFKTTVDNLSATKQ